MKACIGCGCTENNACMTPDGPCAWASIDPPLCSACADGDFAYGPDERSAPLLCAHEFLFTSPSDGYCVRCRVPYCEEIAA